jgi:hypothetical protein
MLGFEDSSRFALSPPRSQTVVAPLQPSSGRMAVRGVPEAPPYSKPMRATRDLAFLRARVPREVASRVPRRVPPAEAGVAPDSHGVSPHFAHAGGEGSRRKRNLEGSFVVR